MSRFDRTGKTVSSSVFGGRSFGSLVGQGQRERERDLREETVYCSPAWDCGKGTRKQTI